METRNYSPKIMRVFIITVAILMIPLVAMQFTGEVDWSRSDFVIMGILIAGTGLMYEMGVKRIKKVNSRVVLTIALALLFLLVWAELAVGVVGTPFAGS